MDLRDDIKDGAIIFLRALTKALTGFIIVPLGILIKTIKPEWEQAPSTIKYLTGVLLLPVTAFLYVAGPWWDDFDIVN
jgi:uncharacterized membrane protein